MENKPPIMKDFLSVDEEQTEVSQSVKVHSKKSGFLKKLIPGKGKEKKRTLS